VFPPRMIQDALEFAQFIDFVRTIGARSYLEIGSKFGGTLFRIGMAMPEGSRCISIDLPRARETASWRSMHGVQRWLEGQHRSCGFIWMDSTSHKAVQQAQQRAPFDLVFIDANHDYSFITRDFANYAPMASKAVAIHDIKLITSGVPMFWDEIKHEHKHREIVNSQSTGEAMGIGIILL